MAVKKAGISKKTTVKSEGQKVPKIQNPEPYPVYRPKKNKKA